eukprot:m.16980 g.16980  ORF g.16980 m.16980 type:complete len:231 (+) comp8087_c0_seq3:74-766(+)
MDVTIVEMPSDSASEDTDSSVTAVSDLVQVVQQQAHTVIESEKVKQHPITETISVLSHAPSSHPHHTTLPHSTHTVHAMMTSFARNNGLEEDDEEPIDVQPEEDRRWLQLLFLRDYTGMKRMLEETPGLVATMELFSGGNSLHYAVRNGDETLFHILLGGDYIVALNQQNFEGNTPLHLAYANNVNNSSKDIIERLIMIGDVNASPCVNVVYVYEYMCVRVHVCVSHVMF